MRLRNRALGIRDVPDGDEEQRREWTARVCTLECRGHRRWSDQLQEILPRKRVTLRRGARLACSAGEWVPMARGGGGSGARARDDM